MRRASPDFKLDVVTQKQDAPDTSSETKKMTGFKDIGEVAAAAPSAPTGGDFATPARTTARGASAPAGKRMTVEQKKEAEKTAAVEEALSKVGVEMMRELACLPYEAWALFFSDPQLKLTEEQAKTLSNSYFLIAKALKPEEMASWKILLALAALQNTRIVLLKLREHSERVENKKKMQGALDMGDGVQVSVI
jgi:hypothetical protein